MDRYSEDVLDDSSDDCNIIKTVFNHMPNSQVHQPSSITFQQPTSSALVLMVECSVCQNFENENNLVKCDVCKMYYHLASLDPPLAQQPKKNKAFGWHCKECDTTEEPEQRMDEPRKL